MKFTTTNGVKLCAFESLASIPRIIHAVSTRVGGVSPAPFDALNLGFAVGDDPQNVVENRRRFTDAAGFDLARVVTTRQVHGSVVGRVDASHRGTGVDAQPEEAWSCDALVTADADVVLMGFAADCPLVLLAAGEVVAIAHAGWRPLVAGILGNTIEAMTSLGADPSKIAAAIGPSIGPCCYEVGAEVKAAAEQGIAGADAWFEPAGGRFMMDLWGLCRRALIDSGLRGESIETALICSRCRQDLFYSHRGSAGRTGRYAAVIGRMGS